MYAPSFFPFLCFSCVLVLAGLAAINCHYQNLSRFSWWIGELRRHPVHSSTIAAYYPFRHSRLQWFCKRSVLVHCYWTCAAVSTAARLAVANCHEENPRFSRRIVLQTFPLFPYHSFGIWASFVSAPVWRTACHGYLGYNNFRSTSHAGRRSAKNRTLVRSAVRLLSRSLCLTARQNEECPGVRMCKIRTLSRWTRRKQALHRRITGNGHCPDGRRDESRVYASLSQAPSNNTIRLCPVTYGKRPLTQRRTFGTYRISGM